MTDDDKSYLVPTRLWPAPAGAVRTPGRKRHSGHPSDPLRLRVTRKVSGMGELCRCIEYHRNPAHIGITDFKSP